MSKVEIPEMAQSLAPGLDQIGAQTTSRDDVLDVVGELPLCTLVREEIAETAVSDWRIKNALTAINNYDPGTFRHVIRVGAFARHLGVVGGYDELEQKVILMGALLHDLGKVGVDPAIINKPGHLQADEKNLVNQHPEKGYRLTRHLFAEPCYRRIPQIVLTHHRHNASGTPYPSDEALEVMAADGAILLDELEYPAVQAATKLVAVADIYDAITSDRAYNSGIFANPMRVRKVLSESHPDMARPIDTIMAYHFVRFPHGRMPQPTQVESELVATSL